MPFGMTPATLIVGLVVVVLAVLALLRLLKRGTCDCPSGKDASCAGGCSACSGCAVTDKMVVDISHHANKTHPMP